MNPVAFRIAQARRLHGLSQRDVARRAGVSAMAISKYEAGKDVPGSAVLLKLCDALGVGVEALVRPVRIEGIVPEFRKRSSLPVREQRAILAHVSDWLERYVEAEEIKGVRQHGFVFPAGFPMEVETVDDVEDGATRLRSAWHLGTDPIENVTAMLEDKGVKVGFVDAHEGFDACLLHVAGHPELAVVATSRNIPGDRQRMNLAHEAGHLLLKLCGGLDSEAAARRFAGAFLAPKSAVRFELGTQRATLDLRELAILKGKYGLSMQGWIMRARDLGIITPARARSLLIMFRQRGWHSVEPGPSVPQETSSRLDMLVAQAVAESLISPRRGKELLQGCERTEHALPR